MNNLLVFLLILSVSFTVLIGSPVDALGAAVRPGFHTNTLPANDDKSSLAVNLEFEDDNDGDNIDDPIQFFSAIKDEIFVVNNGYILFDAPADPDDVDFDPLNLSTSGLRIIAPFFADVDTRVNGMEVTYGTGTVNGRDAFGINWVEVDCQNDQFPVPDPNPLNSFQLVLIERFDTGVGNFDIEFNYDTIGWEASEASGGDNTCLGGNSARVGYSDSTAANSFEFPGSAVNGAFLDNGPSSTSLIQNSLNSNVLGRYIIPVREGIPHTEQIEIIGGTIIPIDSLALMISGFQSISLWMIPLGIISIASGAYLTRNKWK